MALRETLIRIHILGASGSGTSTLGQHLSRRLDIPYFDSDDYYWKKTDPPFVEKNSIVDRHRILLPELKSRESWVLSGSMDSWSEPFVPLFSLVVFLYVPAEVRIERLHKREDQRHGARIRPGGDMHQAHVDFIAWANQYDQGILAGRNIERHKKWLAGLTCPVLEIDGLNPTKKMAETVVDHIRNNQKIIL